MTDDVDVLFNWWESRLWFAMAVLFACRACVDLWKKRGSPLREFVTSIAFASFGVSDVIEMRTHAWWRPWPLLVLKGACLVVFLACYLHWRRSETSTRDHRGDL